MKIKRISYIAAAFLAFAGLSSCVGDLNVKPIDESVQLPEDVLQGESEFLALLAKCYQGLAVSGSDGPDGSPDIDGIDGGFGQYLRALYYMQELTTDEALITWNDQTVKDLHGLRYSSSDVFISAMYSRIFYQISICNEFIRQVNAYADPDKAVYKEMIAEARALRALSLLHAIDMFGDVPFSTENDKVSSEGPKQMKRADLFEWLDNECEDLISGGNLKGARQAQYGRLDVNFVKMIRAKLNLNAAVYLGISESAAKQYYDVVGTLCKEIKNDYPVLHGKYTDLFCADNDQCTDEIIFGVPQDGVNIQTYGGTTFIVKSAYKGGNAAFVLADAGIDDGWGGLLVTPEFMDKFDEGDVRSLFQGADGDSSVPKDIEKIDFSYGWSSYKFTNLHSDGTPHEVINFVSTDFPLFRAADAYLMLAEEALRGASTVTEADARAAWNAVRTRAGLGSVTDYSLDGLIDERGRELYWECWRRSDLVRFNLLTTGDYLWRWKGGSYEGNSVDSKFNLMPIPVSDLNSNSNLEQNDAWK